MKKLASQFVSFLSYHNAVPAALVVLALGAGGAFASSEGVLPLSALGVSRVDVSALLSADLDAFDFSPTVTQVAETDTGYVVSYSLRTLAPQGDAWALSAKTGEFSVAKSALDATGLQGYVVGKLRDIENGERGYLARAQEIEKEIATKRQTRPANAFASLVGLALEQIPVPVVEKPAPAPAPAPEPARLRDAPVTQSLPEPELAVAGTEEAPVAASSTPSEPPQPGEKTPPPSGEAEGDPAAAPAEGTALAASSTAAESPAPAATVLGETGETPASSAATVPPSAPIATTTAQAASGTAVGEGD